MGTRGVNELHRVSAEGASEVLASLQVQTSSPHASLHTRECLGLSFLDTAWPSTFNVLVQCDYSLHEQPLRVNA